MLFLRTALQKFAQAAADFAEQARLGLCRRSCLGGLNVRLHRAAVHRLGRLGIGAFDALAASQSDRARDILARGLARAEPRAQAVLLERLSALGPERLSPILHRAFELVDPGIADLGVYLSMIAAIGRAGGEGAGALLAGAARRVTWRTPLRAWRVRSAVRGALRASAPAAALGRRSR